MQPFSVVNEIWWLFPTPGHIIRSLTYEIGITLEPKLLWGNLYGFMSLITSTHWAFNGQSFLTSKHSSWPKTAYNTRDGPPRMGVEWFLHLFVQTRWEVVQSVLTEATIQAAKAAAMCMACPEYAHPPLCIPPCLVVQNLSSTELHQLIMYSQSQYCQMESLMVQGLMSICSGLEPWLLQGH